MTYLEVKLGSALPQCCCCLSEMFCGSKRENATAAVEQPRVVLQPGLRRDGGRDGGVGRRNPGATQPASGSKPVKGFWKLMGMTPLLQAPCLCPGDPQRGVTYFPLLLSCDVTWSDPKSLLWSGVKSQLPAVTASLALPYGSPRPVFGQDPPGGPGLPPDSRVYPDNSGLTPSPGGSGAPPHPPCPFCVTPDALTLWGTAACLGWGRGRVCVPSKFCSTLSGCV